MTIPPGYAHVLINPSNEPAAIAGLYGAAFKPDYEPFVEMGGAAHYLIDDNGEQFVPNPRYSRNRPVRRLTCAHESQVLVAPTAKGRCGLISRDPRTLRVRLEAGGGRAKFGDLNDLMITLSDPARDQSDR